MARILIVDDEESILQSLGTLLQCEHHKVVTVNEGGKAMQLLKDESFDLMITDIRMTPVDGMELMKWTREQVAGLPVIVISAYGSEKTEKQCYDMGCVAYIKKPFRINEVITAVHKALNPA